MLINGSGLEYAAIMLIMNLYLTRLLQSLCNIVSDCDTEREESTLPIASDECYEGQKV